MQKCKVLPVLRLRVFPSGEVRQTAFCSYHRKSGSHLKSGTTPSTIIWDRYSESTMKGR